MNYRPSSSIAVYQAFLLDNILRFSWVALKLAAPAALFCGLICWIAGGNPLIGLALGAAIGLFGGLSELLWGAVAGFLIVIVVGDAHPMAGAVISATLSLIVYIVICIIRAGFMVRDFRAKKPFSYNLIWGMKLSNEEPTDGNTDSPEA